ncbi:MAG: helix-turn-helix transcriptional regulator [Deltaproteobacteria bacterium]|nr:helix-turn-helix transcriptional regulator [Deltaproteobacteria bacterium]
MKHKSLYNESEICRRIKASRINKKFTLEQLAKQTGFTKGYLSRIEKSEKSPPISTLGIIARVLGITISFLVGEEEQQTSIGIVKKGERPLIARRGTAFEYSYEAVAQTFPNKKMEPFILTLPLKPKKKMIAQHEGEEILFVLEGTMKFLHGNREYLIEEGDCIYFDSSFPHFGESVGRKEAKCFMVIYTPTAEEGRLNSLSFKTSTIGVRENF